MADDRKVRVRRIAQYGVRVAAEAVGGQSSELARLAGLAILLGAFGTYYLTTAAHMPVWLAYALSGLAVLVGAGVVALSWLGFRRALRLLDLEREVSVRTAAEIAFEMGVAPEFASTTTAQPRVVDIPPVSTEVAVGSRELAAAIAQRVAAAMESIREAERASAEAFDERMRALEERFPEAAEFQKYATANELFIAYQVGELSKRIDKLEEKQLTRLHVVGIVLTTFISTIGLAAGLFAILRAFGLVH